MLLQNDADPQKLFLLGLLKAEMAYVQGRFEQAKANARKSIAAMPAAGDPAELNARLIEALVSIRTGTQKEGIQSALQLVREFEEYKLTGDAANARLDIAEALAGTGGGAGLCSGRLLLRAG